MQHTQHTQHTHTHTSTHACTHARAQEESIEGALRSLPVPEDEEFGGKGVGAEGVGVALLLRGCSTSLCRPVLTH